MSDLTSGNKPTPGEMLAKMLKGEVTEEEFKKSTVEFFTGKGVQVSNVEITTETKDE